jgi:NADP-reducing hydrogenase subunit HndC
MEELCYYIKDNSLCGLGQTAPNPVLSTLKYFRDEYVAHVVDKRCPAGVCKSFCAMKLLPKIARAAQPAPAYVRSGPFQAPSSSRMLLTRKSA